MIFIKSIDIENFGPIKANRINFRELGVNLIKGNNATGKTQTIGAIIFSILGKSVVNLDINSKLSSKVILELSDNVNSQKIVSTILKEGEKQILKQELKPSETAFQLALKDSLKNNRLPNLYFDSYQISKKISEADIFQFEKRFPNLVKSNAWTNIKDYSLNRKSAISEGANFLLKFLSFYLDHQKSTIKLPLIIDNGFSLIDSGTKEFIYSILFELGENHQVIYTSFELPNIEKYHTENIIVTELKLNKERQVSPVNFNYNLPFRFKSQIPKKKDNRFYLNDTFYSDENINIEFKEVKGNNPKNSIKSLADQYIVAYLNSTNNEVGRIFWGVSNDKKQIVGIKLNQDDRDDLRKSLTEQFLSIKPEINPSAFSIIFHPIYSRTRKAENLFLLEILVPPIHSKYLYSTAKGEVYIKTDAGKKKLNMMQIQLELEERIKADNI